METQLILTAISQLSNRMETRLNSIETRLETIETRLDTIETRVENLENRVSNVQMPINQLPHIGLNPLEKILNDGPHILFNGKKLNLNYFIILYFYYLFLKNNFKFNTNIFNLINKD